jgi:hypothetical protein
MQVMVKRREIRECIDKLSDLDTMCIQWSSDLFEGGWILQNWDSSVVLSFVQSVLVLKHLLKEKLGTLDYLWHQYLALPKILPF